MTSQDVVHVVDDDAGMRKSLQMLFDSAGLEAHTYESAETFLDEVKLDRPGCLVLDLRMRGLGGMELLSRLGAEATVMAVIIISGHADVPTAVRGMKIGALDVLQKPFDPRVLLAAVRDGLEKSRSRYRQRAEELARTRRLAELTPRERDLLKLLVAGRSNKQIAHDLKISIKTVANHRASLMAKTGAVNAADLTRLSVLAGIQPAEVRPV